MRRGLFLTMYICISNLEWAAKKWFENALMHTCMYNKHIYLSHDLGRGGEDVVRERDHEESFEPFKQLQQA